ncbi:hypothetical protein, partial [Rossellomorea marisflavi]|uniref:hypothetical protein n=1 Tax=Rossellomorea marisflavi TaxID=189381 RepID=UPI00345D5DBC
ADSYGKSGQGETLQACRSGSPHAPWKAAGRSGTKRTIPFFIPHKKGLRVDLPPLHSYTPQSAVQRRTADSRGNQRQG